MRDGFPEVLRMDFRAAQRISPVGWSENHFFEVNVSKVALRYQNTVYGILARSVRCKDPRKIVEVLEML